MFLMTAQSNLSQTQNYDVVNSNNKQEWLKAMNTEMQSLQEN